MPKERKKVKSDFGINQCLPRKEKKLERKKCKRECICMVCFLKQNKRRRQLLIMQVSALICTPINMSNLPSSQCCLILHTARSMSRYFFKLSQVSAMVMWNTRTRTMVKKLVANKGTTCIQEQTSYHMRVNRVTHQDNAHS